jgi:hypothetical protein
MGMSRHPLRPAAWAPVLLVAACSLGAQDEGTKEAPPEPDAPPPAAEEPAAEAGAAEPAEKQPEFKKETTKVDFEKAKGLLAEGKAKQAETLFKKAKADGKTKDDKDLVDAWILAANGSQVLDKLRGVAKQGKLHAAHAEAEAQLAKYGKTQAAPAFQEFIAELEAKLFVVLQTFESPAKDRDGRSHDSEDAFEGKYSLRWQNTEDRRSVPLRIEGAPRDWREFEAVDFHVKVAIPPGAPEAILVCAEEGPRGKAAGKKSSSSSSGFSAQIKLPAPGEWQRVRIPLSDFLPSGSGGNPSLGSIAYFQLQCAPGRQFDLRLDKVVLVKKDPGPAGAKSAKGKSARKG